MDPYVIMPLSDYRSICYTVRKKTDRSGPIVSGDLASIISAIPTGGGDGSSFAEYISGTSENVELPYGTTAIRNYSFFKNSVITTVSIPGTVTSIGVESFRECSGLTSIEIPASVTTVGYRAFWYDMGLTTVVFRGIPSDIKSDAFLSSGVLDIYVPWQEGAVSGAPWGAVNATIHYESEV